MQLRVSLMRVRRLRRYEQYANNIIARVPNQLHVHHRYIARKHMVLVAPRNTSDARQLKHGLSISMDKLTKDGHWLPGKGKKEPWPAHHGLRR